MLEQAVEVRAEIGPIVEAREPVGQRHREARLVRRLHAKLEAATADLGSDAGAQFVRVERLQQVVVDAEFQSLDQAWLLCDTPQDEERQVDRKSTRLNSSH